MVGGPKRRTSGSSAISSSSSSAQMKFRPAQQMDVTRATAKGTKPLPNPESVSEIFTRVVMFGCKRILFVETKYRLLFYTVFLFLVSLIGDYFPMPRTYFANSNNVPNQYFVKLSWGWTLMLTSVFVFLTTSVTCAGNRQMVMKHLSRLAIATLMWFIWTNLFSIIEESTGQCVFTKNTTSAKETVIVYSKSKKGCRSGGGKWTSFDISGHSFLLMWCVFVITEEAKAILGWENIPTILVNEEYKRKSEYSNSNGTTTTITEGRIDTPVSHLSAEEFESLKINYNRYNIWTKVVLILLTALAVLWDIMLMATATYFHVMIEKVIAGLIAVMAWYFTYKGFYKMESLSFCPGLPGTSHFKPSKPKPVSSASSYAKSSYNSTTWTSSTWTSSSSSNQSSALPSRQRLTTKDTDVPKFLGMPLNPLMKSQRNVGETFEGI